MRPWADYLRWWDQAVNDLEVGYRAEEEEEEAEAGSGWDIDMGGESSIYFPYERSLIFSKPMLRYCNSTTQL